MVKIFYISLVNVMFCHNKMALPSTTHLNFDVDVGNRWRFKSIPPLKCLSLLSQLSIDFLKLWDVSLLTNSLSSILKRNRTFVWNFIRGDAETDTKKTTNDNVFISIMRLCFPRRKKFLKKYSSLRMGHVKYCVYLPLGVNNIRNNALPI